MQAGFRVPPIEPSHMSAISSEARLLVALIVRVDLKLVSPF